MNQNHVWLMLTIRLESKQADRSEERELIQGVQKRGSDRSCCQEGVQVSWAGSTDSGAEGEQDYEELTN